MAEPRFADDDDLPRTLRRERDARERELRERDMPAAAPEEPYRATEGHGYPAPAYSYDDATGGLAGTVQRLDIPFFHLVMFFIKAAVAAIPALLLLVGILLAIGFGVKTFLPNVPIYEIRFVPVK